jgi:hypothetical protein
MTTLTNFLSVNHRGRPDEWIVRLIATLTAIMGLVNLVSATFPALTSRLALLERALPL